jgi:hypothetical protein
MPNLPELIAELDRLKAENARWRVLLTEAIVFMEHSEEDRKWWAEHTSSLLEENQTGSSA